MDKFLENRLQVLRSLMQQMKLHGLILNQPQYIFYLTNWLPPSWAAVFLVIGKNNEILVTPFIPEDIPANWSKAITYKSFDLNSLISPTQNATAAIQQALRQLKLISQPVGAVLRAFPSIYTIPLSQQVEFHDAWTLMTQATTVKDEAAQKAIKQRVGFLDRSFELAAITIKPGISELDVFGTIYTSLTKSLGEPFTLDCTIASGKRTILSEPQPTNKLLQLGEVVLIDLFPILGGYAADYTRNFIVGEPSIEQQSQHAVLEKALSAAESRLKPGVLASEIDRIIRNIIEEEGFGKYIHQHHSGHAFGLTTPEPPWLIPADNTPLRSGMVIAVEPGIYHPVNGGMRLEGNYLITDDGCEPLVGFPPILTVCK